NSTLAAALTANKMSIALGHLESGLRSFDRTMPEEINRILVDEISDYHFVTEKSGVDNLLKEGKNQETIFFVGNTMIDTLVAFENDIKSRTNLKDLRIEPNKFILMTLHRPATVDNNNGLSSVLELLEKLTDKATVVFPVHPRTRNNIDKFGLEERLNQIENLEILGPSDYFSFQNLIRQSRVVLTDSGGIQEETTFKQIPCFTLRPNTERPSTIIEGSNTLIDFDSDSILTYIDSVFRGNYKDSSIPKYWDGEATQRILKIISKLPLSAV
ncbi:MAG: UDP-N-acetylglucosamine 2-epimerase (non-hydrolyzing), partial [Bacteroidota bacterium]